MKWWDVVLTLLGGVDGQPPTLLAVSRDITAAREAQLALQASEARLRSLITATSAIVWNCPVSGTFDSGQSAWSAFPVALHEIDAQARHTRKEGQEWHNCLQTLSALTRGNDEPAFFSA